MTYSASIHNERSILKEIFKNYRVGGRFASIPFGTSRFAYFCIAARHKKMNIPRKICVRALELVKIRIIFGAAKIEEIGYVICRTNVC